MEPKSLTVRVNDELLLDAGIIDEEGKHLPPSVPAISQIINYLNTKPEAISCMSEAGGLAKLCLRWSATFAYLTDHDKPLWEHANDFGAVTISACEHKRIAVETANGLARLMKMAINDEEDYQKLLAKAETYLPPPCESDFDLDLDNPFAAATDQGGIVRHGSVKFLFDLATEAHNHPHRALADRVTRMAWNAGPARGMCRGDLQSFPLDRRRLTDESEIKIMQFAMVRFAQGMNFLRELSIEAKKRVFPLSDAVSLALCLPEMGQGIDRQGIRGL